MVITLVGILLSAIAAQPTAQAPPTPQASPSPAPEPSVEELYRSILPAPMDDPAAPTGEAVGQAAGTADGDKPEGLYLGRLQVTPTISAVYTRAEGALLDDAAPVEDSYYEIRPRVGAEMPVSYGFLRGGYQAVIRRGSSFDVIDSTITHLADLSFDFPLGASAEITGSEHYARGLLETAEVDPGREYFFRLGHFTRHRHALGLRLLPGGRANAAVGGSIDSVRVDDQAAFFDHDQQGAFAQIGYEVTPVLQASLGYGYSRIPFTEERPEAESQMHSVYGELRGEVLPLTTGSVSAGYTVRNSPRAAAGGQRFSGLTAAGRLEKSFTPSTSFSLGVIRATNASNFDENGFYVTSAVEGILRAALPASLALQAGAGYHRNGYQTVASSIGVPRRDTIRGWTLGLGRPVTRRAFARVDYRSERRDSNIDAFDSRSNVLTVQIGIGLFAAQSR